MSQWGKVRKRIAGKWQIPLFVVSLALLALSFIQIRPKLSDQPLDASLKHMDGLIESGGYETVIRLGQSLLAVKDTYNEADFAAVRLRLARARHGSAVAGRQRSPDAGRDIVDNLEVAEKAGLELTSLDHARWADGLDWMDLKKDALKKFEQSIAMDAESTPRVARRAFELREMLGEPVDSLLAMLDEFVARAPEHRLDLEFWALEQRVELLVGIGKPDLAATALVRAEPMFADSDFESFVDYLKAFVLYRQRHFDETETALRAILNSVESTDQVFARAGWLMGHVVMKDDGPKRPYESISFFEDVLRAHADTSYGVASHLGLGEAYAMLGRHAEALESFQTSIDNLSRFDASRLVNRDVVRVSLGLRALEQRDIGALRAARAYARLALELVSTGNNEQNIAFLQQLLQIEEMLADMIMENADASRDLAERQALLDEAAATYVSAAENATRVSQLSVLNPQIAADATWKSTELLAKSGDRKRAAQMLEVFTNERPDHALVPRALLRIGQLRQAEGDLDSAIDAYRNCYNANKRTIDGLRALIPLARCYMAFGQDKEHLVESTLKIVLNESEVFTPEAPEYSDALFLFGELLNRQGEFERAIGKIEEALDRYPRDERVWSGRALLADSYRQSGLALKKEVASAGSASEIEGIRAEAAARFERARELYRGLIDELAQRAPSTLDALQQLNLRHAYVYEADCFFEMARYHEALKLYEEAASVHKETQTAVSAYVQIINCHVFLGQPEEARAALARARILVDTMPDESFRKTLSPESRNDWQRYFAWLEDAELF